MKFVIEKTVEIKAPAAVVWEVISDLARYPEWNPFCVECRSTMQPGDAIDMKVKLMARPQAQREWVSEHVAGRRFAYAMKPAPLGALSSFRSHDVEAIGDSGTRYRSYFHLQGWLKPLVVGLLGSRLEIGFAGMTDGIRQRAEALWIHRQSQAGGG
ncbi:SRPBCC domain-containing protein [Solimonas terrae]|uniref:SRPBCC domain-containing protein n=1 Tax=Solimonas terrae TaxID=1396819 RepID=A0A6M2BQJ5_9GAMM|nr:SRPBCC domain-containing protein [Solimonas terrae]NGY04902.1 SRPBCC domain-containing protein [Solimonas terrae]